VKRTYPMFARRTVITVLTAFAFAAALPQAGFAQSGGLLGTWKLIPERSTFQPGPAPYRSMTLHFSATERGLKNDAMGIDADGRPIEGTYMIVADGKFYPVTGMSEFDSSSYTPVSDTTTVYVRRKLGTTVVAGSRVLSRNGETLFFREKTVDEQGIETARATLVFEKQ
jgi:hypothetical protein